MDSVVIDARKHVGEPGLRIDVVEFGGHDQGRHDGGTLGTAIGAGEQPGFAAQGKAAQGSFGCVVGQADPAVVDEAGEAVPSLEHIVDRLGDRGRARQAAPLLAQPGFQSLQERRALFLTDAQPLGSGNAIDATLDLEQDVNALDCLQRDRRDRSRILASP